MKIRQILSVFIAASILSASSAITTVNVEAVDATSYSYEVIPVLEGMNTYYFVKTNNPNPETFAFIDKDTKYWDGPCLLQRCTYKFADVVYENDKTLRVDGGYLFEGSSSDGGTLTLSIQGYDEYFYPEWVETNITCKAPATVDYIDYLINTYAVHDDFFDNMSAIESGLVNISRYSGSYILGTLSRIPNRYWGLTAHTHLDQSFYLCSPYTRTDNQALFASFVYPYCCDSLGFPSILAMAAKRMEPTAEYEWDSYNHYLINITFNGITNTYGGQGSGKGQGISKDKITKYFHFGGSNDTVKLADIRQLLVEYSNIEMENDIPSEGRLTWKQINDTVENGSWTKVDGGYSYFYKVNDDDYYYTSDHEIGDSVYWSGSLGYASNTWVDGRYVNNNEVYEPGAKLEDHTDANVILYNAPVPAITFDYDYEYNYEEHHYELAYYNINVTYSFKTIELYYDDTNGYWTTYLDNDYYWDDIIEKGLLDSSYLDCIRYTMDDLKAMGVDKNTDITPECGYIYDITVEPGTTFGTFNGISYEINDDFLFINRQGGTQVLKLSSIMPEMIDAMSDDIDTLSYYINATTSDTSSDSFILSDAQIKAIEYILAADYS